MHNPTLSQTWVKNVYSLWVEGVVNRVNLYTGLSQSPTKASTVRVQPSLIPKFMDSFPLFLYTAFFRQLTDVKLRLSTLSTAPIIKKKN